MRDIIEKLNWRYAVKEFTTQKLPQEKVDSLLDCMRLSASSFGLQPWKFIQVETPAVREKLLAHSFGQTKVRDASHLLVLARLKTLDDVYVDKYINDISKKRNVSIESLADFSASIKRKINGMSELRKSDYMTEQIYIVMGTLLTAAAMAQIDACPMGGFSPKGYDEVLGLDEMGVTSVMIATLGYRSPDDPQLKRKKVRFNAEEIVITI